MLMRYVVVRGEEGESWNSYRYGERIEVSSVGALLGFSGEHLVWAISPGAWISVHESGPEDYAGKVYHEAANTTYSARERYEPLNPIPKIGA